MTITRPRWLVRQCQTACLLEQVTKGFLGFSVSDKTLAAVSASANCVILTPSHELLKDHSARIKTTVQQGTAAWL